MAVDMFLKLDGIDGESVDSKHKGEIEILSFSWGVSNAAAAGRGGAAAGRVSSNDFSIVKRLDTASPQLMEKVCRGEHLGSGLITLRKAGEKQQEYLKIELKNILISGYQTGGSGGESEPVEQVSFSFQSVEMSAAEQRPDGSTGGWKSTSSCTFGGRQ
jgi:type VI secretion system secreted protein Hcp